MENLKELIEDLQDALSKALNNKVVREYEHLQVRCEKAIKQVEANSVLGGVMLSLPSDEEISHQAKQKYPHKKTKEGTYYEGKSKGYAEGANWMKFQIEKLNEA